MSSSPTTATGRMIIDSTTVVTTIPNTTGGTTMIPSHSDRMLHQRKQTVTNASCCCSSSCSSVSSDCSTASIGVTSISQMSGISISSCSATTTTGSCSVYLPASAAAAVIPSLEHQEHSSRKSSCPSTATATATATTPSLPVPRRHQNDIHHQHHNEEEEEESHIGTSTAAGKKCSITLDRLTPSAVSSSQPISFPKCKVSYPEEEEEIMSMEQSIEYYNACTWQMYHRIMKSRRSRSRTNSHHQHQKKLFISTLNQATVSYEEVDSHCESLLQRQASLGVEAIRVPTFTTKTTLAQEDNKDDIIFKLDLI